jgi:hypothetical protein
MSVAPFAAFAVADFNRSLYQIGSFINLATPIVVALALLGFFWGLAVYIFQSGTDEKRKKGLSIMIWGIIALFVMLSVFGIINALQSTLGVGNGAVSTPRIDPGTGQGTQQGGVQ